MKVCDSPGKGKSEPKGNCGIVVGRKPRIRVPKKTTQKMKKKLKKLCREGRGRNLERFTNERLNFVLRGWTNYFRLSETKTFAEQLLSLRRTST